MYKSKRPDVFEIVNYTFLFLLGLITLYPFWDSFVVSLVPFNIAITDKFHIIPKEITLEAYSFLISIKEFWSSYGNTLFVLVVATSINIVLTIMTGYALSKRWLKGHKTIMVLILFTMLFQGGIIPTYIIVQKTGLMNTLWALIIPSAINTYNMIVMRNFFSGVPQSLEDSARIDGCSEIGTLIHIVIPMSIPAIATISLFYAVFHWNAFFEAVMYISSRKRWTLQVFLRAMLYENEAASHGGYDEMYMLGMNMKMAAVMATTIPIICLYPFIQKYFVKGMLIGAIKG